MIEVKNLKKSYGSRMILRGVSLTVQAGETLVIIGGSGCGKSTFLKCVVSLTSHEEGTISVDGIEVGRIKDELELAQYRQKIGYLFQEGALFDSMTVWENVTFGLRYLTNIPSSRYKKIASEKLALVGLKDIEHLKPSELSGGMKKRVALARAIASDPSYILYDEPTTGLDPIMSDVISDLILDLQKKLNVTSIMVTHDMKSAYKVASRIAMLHEGKLLAVGTPDEIKKTKNPYVRQFVDGLSQGPIHMKLRDFDPPEAIQEEGQGDSHVA